MDCRNSFGASGKGPSMAWLPITMNSVSPVTPLDARRMCSRSERFIAAQDLHPFVLRHNNCERAAVSHAEGILAAIGQLLKHALQTTRADQVKPFCQCVL